MAAASGASPAPAPPAADRDWMASPPAHAAAGFAEDTVVLAYHGSLLYEAIIKKVLWKDGRVYSYVVNYQGWKKSWDAEVPHNTVYEHNDDNLRIAHTLLQRVKQRQQAIVPVDDRHFSPVERDYVSFVAPSAFPVNTPEHRASPAQPASGFASLPSAPQHASGRHGNTLAPVASPRHSGQRIASPQSGRPGSARRPLDTDDAAAAGQQPSAKSIPSIGPTPPQHRSPSTEHSTPIRRPPSEQYPGMMRASPMPARCAAVKTEPPTQVNGHPNGVNGTNRSDLRDADNDVHMRDVKASPAPAVSTPTPPRSSPTDEAVRPRGVPRMSRPGASSDGSESLFFLPAALKQQLVDDWEFVTKEHRLVPLPRKHSVSSIVDMWARSHAAPEDIACREVAEGIKAYFDAALPTTLLYKFERLQFNEFYFGPNSMARNDAYPVRHYGAEHLTRLLLKLPYMLESTGVDVNMMRRIAEKVNDLARFMAENGRLLFLYEYDVPHDDYIRKVQNGDTEPPAPDPESSPADDSPRSIDAPPPAAPSSTYSTPARHSTSPRHTPGRSPAATPGSARTPLASSPSNRGLSPGSSHGVPTPSPARSTPRS